MVAMLGIKFFKMRGKRIAGLTYQQTTLKVTSDDIDKLNKIVYS